MESQSNVDMSGLDRIQSEIRTAERLLRTPVSGMSGQAIAASPEHGHALYLEDWGREKRMFLAERGIDGGGYLRENFKPEDRIAIVLIRGDHVIQRIDDAGSFSKDRYQDWLRDMNGRGYNVHYSMNTLKPDATHRTAKDIAHVRHVWLDMDKGGRTAVSKILASDLPQPHYLVNTSADHYQVIWRAEKFSRRELLPLLKNLARETGADPQATDAARVMRLPGFVNQKYQDRQYYVTVEKMAGVGPVIPQQFPERLYTLERDRVKAHEPQRTRSREPGGRVPAEILVDRALAGVPNGGRNAAGFALAVQLRDNGYSPDEAERAMRSYRERVPGVDTAGRRDPYTEREMRASLWSAYQSPAREPWAERSR